MTLRNIIVLLSIFTGKCFSQVNYLDNVSKSATGVLGAYSYGPSNIKEEGFSLFTGTNRYQISLAYSKTKPSKENGYHSVTYIIPSLQIHTNRPTDFPVGFSFSLSHIIANKNEVRIPRSHLILTPAINYKLKYFTNDLFSFAFIPEVDVNHMLVLAGENESETSSALRISNVITVKSDYSIMLTVENAYSQGHTVRSLYFGLLIKQ